MSGPKRTSASPINVEAGQHIFHRGTDRYLGEVTDVKRTTVRFTGPDHADGLATRHEIYVGEAP